MPKSPSLNRPLSWLQALPVLAAPPISAPLDIPPSSSPLDVLFHGHQLLQAVIPGQLATLQEKLGHHIIVDWSMRKCGRHYGPGQQEVQSKREREERQTERLRLAAQQEDRGRYVLEQAWQL